jgi:Protein of unknown function (DUF1499)
LSFLSGLTASRAATDPRSADPRLRGRTYAIAFDHVWNAALGLTCGGARGWSLGRADDQAGVIEARTKALLFGIEGEVRIEIGLDENAQTRVDLLSHSVSDRADLGHNRRVIGRFLRKLDKALHAEASQILDPTRAPAWITEAR